MAFINRFLFVCVVLLSSFTQAHAEGKKNITFIVNPISHEIKDSDIQAIIESNLDLDQFEYKIVFTERANHATLLAKEAVGQGVDIIAAVGGDGTVNEVGKALINTQVPLAVIPVGSGNGLARHLRIPVGLTESIKALNVSQPISMDTFKINDTPGLGFAGVGFDAFVAWEFAQYGERGLFAYCKIALKEYPGYKPKTYYLSVDGRQMVKSAFILTIANTSQYGNDFIIAPKARVQDGYLDLVMIDDIPTYALPSMVYQFRNGTLHQSSHFEAYRFKELLIHQTVKAHVDGEPVLFKDPVKITVLPASLKIMVPKK